MKLEADISEAVERLKQLSNNAATVDTVLEQFAAKCVAAIRADAPVASGRMRNSVDFEMVDGGVNIFVGVDYAVFVEYGTVNQPAQPFFEINIRQYLPELEQRITRELTK